jgi:hypothetical protein
MPYNTQDAITRLQEIINKSQPDYFGRTNISFSDLTAEDIAAIKEYLASGKTTQNPWQGLGPKITPPPVATPPPPASPPGTTPPLADAGNTDPGNPYTPNGGFGISPSTDSPGESLTGAQNLTPGHTMGEGGVISDTPSNWNIGSAAKAAGKDFAHNLPFSMNPISLAKSLYAGIKGGYTPTPTGTFTSPIPGMQTSESESVQNMVNAQTAQAEAQARADAEAAMNQANRDAYMGMYGEYGSDTLGSDIANQTAYSNMYGAGDAGEGGDGGSFDGGYDSGYGVSWGMNSYAQGGTPPVGVPVLTGEKGREMFVPQPTMTNQMANAGTQRRLNRPTPNIGGMFANAGGNRAIDRNRQERQYMRSLRPGNIGTGTSGSGNVPFVPPTGRTPVILGQNGPQRFVANTPGTIIPNGMTEQMLRSGQIGRK